MEEASKRNSASQEGTGREKLNLGKKGWYFVSLIAFVIQQVFLYLDAPDSFAVLFIVTLLILIFTALIWLGIGRIIIRPIESLLPIFTRERKKNSSELQYFVEPVREPPNILVRTFRVLIGVLGFSSYLFGLYLTGCCGQSIIQGSDSLIFHPIEFMLFSILILAVLPFGLFPAWVCDDSGLRHYNPASGTVSVPGAKVKEFLTTSGLLLSVVDLVTVSSSFGVSLLSSLGEIFTVVFLGLVLFVPSCILAIVLFHFSIEPKVLAKFRGEEIIRTMGRGLVQIQPHMTPDLGPVSPSQTENQSSTSPIPRNPQSQTTFCQNCGFENHASARFCEHCGADFQKKANSHSGT